MGLAFNSGPSWEDDSLNQIQIDSVEENATDMLKNRRLMEMTKEEFEMLYRKIKSGLKREALEEEERRTVEMSNIEKDVNESESPC